MALTVDWVATNPGFHPIPTGYGLPWGTPEEEDIPQSLVNATEFELAREQLKTQTPDAFQPSKTLPASNKSDEPYGVLAMVSRRRQLTAQQDTNRIHSRPGSQADSLVKQVAKTTSAASGPELQAPDQLTVAENNNQPELLPHASQHPQPLANGPNGAFVANGSIGQSGAELPANWPDPRGLIPAQPSPVKPAFRPSNKPVLTHTRTYNGHDAEFTKSLQNYYSFRDDARFGGWQSYLQRSDDFIRFCCHSHLTEMLSARGGASETRVVWRWSERR
jgi:hypothetical protein